MLVIGVISLVREGGQSGIEADLVNIIIDNVINYT